MHHFKQKKFKYLPLTLKTAQTSSLDNVHSVVRVGHSDFHGTPFFIYAKIDRPISKCIDFSKIQLTDE